MQSNEARLTSLHMLVLGRIAEQPLSRLEDVALSLGLDEATAVAIHDDLEAAGMIRRAPEQ
jgi:DNA-binding MarR family transcriptional regulator